MGKLFRLQRFDVMRQVHDALLHFGFVTMAHLPEDRTPDRHLAITVSRHRALSPKNARYSVSGKLAAVVLGQCGKVGRRNFERSGGWPITFPALAVTGRAIRLKHFLARSWRGRRCRHMLDLGFFLLSLRKKDAAHTYNADPNQPALKRHETSFVAVSRSTVV